MSLWMRSRRVWMKSSRLWMRFSRVVSVFDSQCQNLNCAGFDPSILRHSGIWRMADEAVLNKVLKKNQKYPPSKYFFFVLTLFLSDNNGKLCTVDIKNWIREGRCFVAPLTFFKEETSCVEPVDSDLRYFFILHVFYKQRYSGLAAVL